MKWSVKRKRNLFRQGVEVEKLFIFLPTENLCETNFSDLPIDTNLN